MKIEMKKDIKELRQIVINGKFDGFQTPIEIIDIMIQKMTNKVKFKKYQFSDIIDNIDWDEMKEKLIGYYYDKQHDKWIVAISPNICYFIDRNVFGLIEKEIQYHRDATRDAVVQENVTVTAAVVFQTDNDYVVIDKVSEYVYYDNEGKVNTETSSSKNLSNVPIDKVYNEECLFIHPPKIYAS